MYRLALLLALSGCAHRAPSQPVEIPKTDIAYADVAARALKMADNGWIVSRASDGSMVNVGDSLIWTGVTMGALSCDDGGIPEAALIKMLINNHGVPYRHPSIMNEYTLDGLLGLWWGIEQRTRRCPETRSKWAELLPQHEQAIAIEPGFHAVLQQLMANLGKADPPSAEDRGKLGAEVGGWAMLVVSHKAAAYRLHLGFLALSIIDAPHGHNVFCTAVEDAKIALLEHFCGRPGLQAWLEAFKYNVWHYQFQRGAWETPDNDLGVETPAVDLLVALRMLYP